MGKKKKRNRKKPKTSPVSQQTKSKSHLDIFLHSGNTFLALIVQDILSAFIMHRYDLDCVSFTWFKLVLNILTQHGIEGQVAAQVVTSSNLCQGEN